MPEITVFTSCDTILAVNLRMFNIQEYDEFIFTIKNYDYTGAPYVFLYRAKLSDVDRNGEVIFKIPQVASKHLKPGAFYNVLVLKNAFDAKQETSCVRLTDNGKINLIYGAHDLAVVPDYDELEYDVISARLELVNEPPEVTNGDMFFEIVDVRLEQINI
jgi:hypothetical protein